MANDSMSSMADMECNNFFDHIDDLLDFPEENNKTAADGTAFSGAWSTLPHSLLNPDSVIGTGCSSDLSAELSIPYEDIVQMEWLSMFMEDSFGAGNTMTLDRREFPVTDNIVGVAAAAAPPIQFRLSSPISVLESSSTSSCSEGVKILPVSHETARTKEGCGRARSKRPRPPTFSPGSAMQLTSPAQSFIDTVGASGEELNESLILSKASAASEQKKIKKSVKPSCQVEMSRNESSGEPAASVSQAGVRKCLHCEITKTPQWRAGPLGPKTLCNACGVRYKSGRLFPEYRPAASPTFVPSLHSNSHKKVLEMRTSTVDTPPAMTSQDLILIDDAGPEFIPNKGALLEYM